MFKKEGRKFGNRWGRFAEEGMLQQPWAEETEGRRRPACEIRRRSCIHGCCVAGGWQAERFLSLLSEHTGKQRQSKHGGRHAQGEMV